MRATLRELLPSVAESLTPPDTRPEPTSPPRRRRSEEIRDFALGGLTRRLDIIGVPLASL